MTEAHTYQFATINGAEVHYQLTGTGKPLVFIHAGICDLRMWDDQIAAFSPLYQVLRYDVRAYGQTKPVEGRYSNLDDLLTLLNRLQIEKAVLVGCSMGGSLAMDFTVTHPDRVAALVMVCSNPSGYAFSGETPSLYSEIVAAWEAGDVERTAELEMQFWAVGVKRSVDDVPVSIRHKVAMMNLIALKNDKMGIGKNETPKINAVEHLGEINVPVLAIAGSLDDDELMSAADLMADSIANGRKRMMPTAHLPNMEMPDEFNQHVSDFLREIGY